MRFFSLFLFFLLGQTLYANTCSLLIIGCGRSGTTYIAQVLQKSGYDINHEQFGKDGCVSWSLAVNSYSPWGPECEEVFQQTFHQTRHPLPVITSWVNNLNDLSRDEWVFIRKHVPEIKITDSPIVSAAKYWYYWNLIAEKKAHWRYQIEKFDSILLEFQIKSGLIINNDQLKKIATNTNSWMSIPTIITWSELKAELPQDLYDNIQTMAFRYGYRVID